MSTEVPLALPKTNEGILIPAITGTPAGDDVVGIAQGNLRFKVANYQISTRTKVMETTGDGDLEPSFDSDQMPKIVVRLTGWMLANDALNLYALAGNTITPASPLPDNTGQYALRINMSSERFFNGYVIIGDVDIAGAQNSVAISVAATFYVTNTSSATLETALGAPV